MLTFAHKYQHTLDYIQLRFEHADAEQKEILIALLSAEGAEGFEETETGLNAFIPAGDFNEEQIDAVIAPLELNYSTSSVQQQNWNQQWEESFQPVTIGNFCRIRAHFHPADASVQHDILITPKMSFGTGHHATTRLMAEQMATIAFGNTRVLDFGTGTGVLAILAEQLGATDIVAIDNDEWSYENAVENAANNHCSHIQVQLGVLEDLPAEPRYDIILANINRHILLAGMERMASLLHQDGTLLMSGLLTEDAEIVSTAARNAGFSTEVIAGNSGWIGIRCQRPA